MDCYPIVYYDLSIHCRSTRSELTTPASEIGASPQANSATNALHLSTMLWTAGDRA